MIHPKAFDEVAFLVRIESVLQDEFRKLEARLSAPLPKVLTKQAAAEQLSGG